MGSPKKKPDFEALLEEFRLVLAMEEKAAWTYRQLALDCDDEEARSLLFELSRQEEHHVKIALRLLSLAEKWQNSQSKTNR
jgi:rubrerythrin